MGSLASWVSKGGGLFSVGSHDLAFLDSVPKVGDVVYRVWGDEAGSYGKSWTRVDPASVSNYRNIAGLPNQNTGCFISEGYLVNIEDIIQRPAVSLHGNLGGLDELYIPHPVQQIEITKVSGVNPNL